MNFKEEIINLEESIDNNYFLFHIGNYPVLITAVHTMMQFREEGGVKLAEPYTKAIALYVANNCEISYLLKTRDTGRDSNRDNNDGFKRILLDTVKENNIKLVIDLHGAKMNRDFDIEFGTLNNLTADFSTIRELEEKFIEHGIKNIKHNEPFKGGAVTQYLYGLSDVEVIQLEINRNYRNLELIDNMKILCDSLIDFINHYINR